MMRVAEKIVHIGGASGAWGDSPMAIPQLLTADVHYLMMDYLAEVTMSLSGARAHEGRRMPAFRRISSPI